MSSHKQHQDDGIIDSTELLDYDESDEIPEDYESDSDYGKPHKSKGRRTRGRQSKKAAEEARIFAALEARRKRKRLTHGTPDSHEKNPKRRLFGSESQELSETASPTPSRGARAKATLDSSGLARTASRKSTAPAINTPSKQPIHTPLSLHDSVSPAASSSLIVKLRTPGSFATTEEGSAETPVTDMNGKRKGRGKRTITQDEDVREAKAVGQRMHNTKPLKQGRETRSMTRVTRQRGGALAANETAIGTDKSSSSTSKTKQPAATRRWSSTEQATEAYNDTPVSPKPEKATTTRHRRGAMSSVFVPELPTLNAPTSRSENTPSDPWSDGLVIPETSPPPIQTSPSPPDPLSNPLPSSPTTDKPISRPSSAPPRQSSPAPTFAPYPPMSPRSVSPFTRGARIALENVLADHQSDPLLSLIDLVEELDDTRPIVNDWEHVTVMKGGSWIYQVMRDVWEEKEYEEDEGDEETRDEELDIEDVVGKIGGWVDREIVRLGSSGQE